MPEKHLPWDGQDAANLLGMNRKSKPFYHALLRHAVVVHDSHLAGLTPLHQPGVDVALVRRKGMHLHKHKVNDKIA